MDISTTQLRALYHVLDNVIPDLEENEDKYSLRECESVKNISLSKEDYESIYDLREEFGRALLFASITKK